MDLFRILNLYVTIFFTFELNTGCKVYQIKQVLIAHKYRRFDLPATELQAIIATKQNERIQYKYVPYMLY